MIFTSHWWEFPRRHKEHSIDVESVAVRPKSSIFPIFCAHMKYLTEEAFQKLVARQG